jgi:hypothetical protein
LIDPEDDGCGDAGFDLSLCQRIALPMASIISARALSTLASYAFR